MSSLQQLRDFACEAFKLVLEANPHSSNRLELSKRFDNLMDMASDMLESKDTQQQNAISHSFADELITKPPFLSLSPPKQVTVQETNEPTLVIHETLPSVCVTKLDSNDNPFPYYVHEPPQFTALFNKHPFLTSEIVPDETVEDDVNSEDVGVDADDGRDLEEMEIVEHEGKRYFRGISSNDVHTIIGDEEAGECVGTYQNGKVVLQ